MKVTVLCVGKIKEKYWLQAIDEYMKRLGRYCKPEIVEVPDEKTPDGAGEALERQIKEKEGARLLEKLPTDAYVITLEIAGKAMTSPQLAQKIDGLGLSGVSHIVFVIGGSLGLSEAICRRANEALSFSQMTFPHQMMRVILLEQVYRAYRIIHHEPYHK